MTAPTVTTPTIHLNGSSADHLLEVNRQALAAAAALADALQDARPDARDYYVQSDDAYPAARREHAARLENLQTIRAELEAITEAIADQRDARQRTRPGGSASCTTAAADDLTDDMRDALIARVAKRS